MEPNLLHIIAQVSTPLVVAAGVTSVGRIRSENEDRCLIAQRADDGLIAAVADGMGGHAGGSVAAEITIDSISALASRPQLTTKAERYEELLASFYLADSRMVANRDYPSMGSTVVAASISGDGLLHLHAGDSRCYHIRDGIVLYRTVDHSVAQMAGMEAASRGGYGSLVTSCIGGPGDFESLSVDPEWCDDGCAAFRELKRGDQVVLCSDGLWNYVGDAEIAQTVFDSSPCPDIGAELLASLALERGGADNISVIVIDIVADLGSAEGVSDD